VVIFGPKGSACRYSDGSLGAQSVLQLPDIGSETAVLDIGCGREPGWPDWRSMASRLHGVDNQSFVTFPLADETGASFSCTYADLDNDPDLGLGTAKFALITAIEVIEHVHNPERFLTHAARHIEDNGYFLNTTPNLHSVRTRI